MSARLPAIPAGLVTIVEDDAPEPDTTWADTAAAAQAWKAAHEAIMAAWQATPSHMLRTRMSIRRDEFNQGIANQAAIAMMGHANQALDQMRRHRYAREVGFSWAAPSDADAVVSED